jgi:hypothetical protein
MHGDPIRQADRLAHLLSREDAPLWLRAEAARLERIIRSAHPALRPDPTIPLRAELERIRSLLKRRTRV